MSGSDVLDEVLWELRDRAPVYAAHGLDLLDNHAPMLAETLVALERSDAVWPHVHKLAAELPSAPPPQQRIPTEWRQALGAGQRYGDWQLFFRNELADHRWEAVVSTWVTRFVPGLASAGAHGVIRVAHVVRALASRETEERLAELADGLAAWAAHYYELPGSVQNGALRAVEALSRVPRSRAELGTTGTRLRAVAGLPALATVAGLVAVEADGDGFLDEVVSVFTHAYLCVPALTPLTSTGLVHTVTVPAAVRLLLPYLKPEDHQRTCLHAWHVAAAIYAGYAPAAVDSVPALHAAPDWDDLVERAVATGNTHAIKFVEACRRTDAGAGDAFLLAAARAVDIHAGQLPR